MEAGDCIRALIVVMEGFINDGGIHQCQWKELGRSCVSSLPSTASVSDCMSLVNHLISYFLTKIRDKRLEIEVRSMRQSLRDEEENVEAFEKFPGGGDKLLWMHASTMVADCLTKRMRPDLLLQVNRFYIRTDTALNLLGRRRNRSHEAEFNSSQFHTSKVGCV